MPHEVMTIEEVAEYLRLAPRTVYKLVKAGKLPGRKIASRWRFHLNDIEAWLRCGEVVEVANSVYPDDSRGEERVLDGPGGRESDQQLSSFSGREESGEWQANAGAGTGDGGKP